MGMKNAATKTPGDIYIAGSKTVDDWNAFKSTLTVGGDPTVWLKAFDDYFHERLSLRYLGPIKILQDNGSLQGEGFSIAAIQCSLIEFLESTVQGISYHYRPRRKGSPSPGPYEYSDSGDLFVQFLCRRQPFMKDFSRPLARDFYEGVRCGLLHEARTKKGWTIWAKGPIGTVANGQEKIMYRDNFQDALLKFIEWYKSTLPSNTSLQEAFVRKFDSLCQ
jgi:hypothetical protein